MDNRRRKEKNNLLGGVRLKPENKFQINTILLIVCLSALTSFLCYQFMGVNSVVKQEQNIHINSDTREKINLNTASLEELKALPNIENLAEEIIENRPYKSVYDLKKIKGIGDGRVSAIKELVTCD